MRRRADSRRAESSKGVVFSRGQHVGHIIQAAHKASLEAGRAIGLLNRPELGQVADRDFSLRIRRACGVVVSIMEDRRPLIAEGDGNV